MTPLAKRLPRELRNNIGKYLAIFLLMAVSIAVTSGFLLAAHSITVIMDGIRDAYDVEDGRVTTQYRATDAQLEAARDSAEGVGGVDVYENFSIDARLRLADDDGSARTLRTYAHRTKVDIASYCEGGVPEADDEVSVDRVFAKNNGIGLGDTVWLEGRAYTVCGIMTQPDSQALFLNNSDFTINTLSYGVAEVSDSGFAALEDAGAGVAYVYSFSFRDRDMTVAERVDAEEDMVSALTDANASVEDLIDADSNQGIGYAADDVSGDSAIWTTLLWIIIAIMGFVFAVLTTSTIEQESAIIGTLMASGYRRREIVLHYLALPAVVGALSSAIGTGCGLAFMTEPMRRLYYGSYSLPPFYVSWDWSIFLKTGVMPFALLVGVTLVGLLRKMGKTPLQFLRHEASGESGTKRGFDLPERLGFPTRFRIRVFLRNFGNFATLFLGIAFASLLMLFSLSIMPTMSNYADSLGHTLVAEHQYALKAPLELEGTPSEREAWASADRLQTVDAAKLDAAEEAADRLEDLAERLGESPTAELMGRVSDARDALDERLDAIAADLGCDRDEVIDLMDDVNDLDLDDDDVHPVNTTDNGAARIAQAEKYAVYTLQYDRGEGNGKESVTVYGVSTDSTYWKGLGVGDGRVVFGAGLVDKFGFVAGQGVTMYDKYEGRDVTLELADDSCVWGTESNMSVYMSLGDFNELFDNDADYFNGYVSDEELEIDARYYAGDTTPDDMRAIGDQFVNMMNEMLVFLVGLSVCIFVIFIYLLTKSVIDRSARSISYMKVFGYRDREISGLYVRSITVVVATSLVLCIPALLASLSALFKVMLSSYSGNIRICAPAWAIAATVAAGLASYLVVAGLHVRSIKRVELSEALKVQE